MMDVEEVMSVEPQNLDSRRNGAAARKRLYGLAMAATNGIRVSDRLAHVHLFLAQGFGPVKSLLGRRLLFTEP